MPNNPIPDAALAELDRLHAAALFQYGVRRDESAWYSLGNHTTGPHIQGDIYADRETLTRLATVWNAYPALRQRLLDAESRLAEAERERGVSSMPPDYVKNVIRASRGDRKKMREATARAETAEASLAVLRGALDIARVKFDWIRQNAEPPAIDGGIGSVWRAAISAHTEVVAALALTPASAGNRTDEETEAANGR